MKIKTNGIGAMNTLLIASILMILLGAYLMLTSEDVYAISFPWQKNHLEEYNDANEATQFTASALILNVKAGWNARAALAKEGWQDDEATTEEVSRLAGVGQTMKHHLQKEWEVRICDGQQCCNLQGENCRLFR